MYRELNPTLLSLEGDESDQIYAMNVLDSMDDQELDMLLGGDYELLGGINWKKFWKGVGKAASGGISSLVKRIGKKRKAKKSKGKSRGSRGRSGGEKPIERVFKSIDFERLLNLKKKRAGGSGRRSRSRSRKKKINPWIKNYLNEKNSSSLMNSVLIGGSILGGAYLISQMRKR